MFCRDEHICLCDPTAHVLCGLICEPQGNCRRVFLMVGLTQLRDRAPTERAQFFCILPASFTNFHNWERTPSTKGRKYSEGYTVTAKLARFIGHLEARRGIAPEL